MYKLIGRSIENLFVKVWKGINFSSHVLRHVDSLVHITSQQKRQLSVSLPVIRSKNSTMSLVQANEVAEGLAKVLLPKAVFYNPVQEYNRDLTIAVITEHVKLHCAKTTNSGKNKKREQIDGIKKEEDSAGDTAAGDTASLLFDELKPGQGCSNGIKIFEGLAASGLRSVRFGLEIPGVKEVLANDYDKSAVDFIEKNIIKNNLSHIMKSNHGDAAMIMYQNRSQNSFHVIDLDPYGSPHTFLDAAVQSVQNGGLLCVTCTDAAVLCGNALEKCNTNYGSVPLKAKFQHEMALRIILQCLDSHANRYSRYIEPLISLSIDFYFRVFVRIHFGQQKAKRSVLKKAMVYECVGCGSYALQPVATALPTKGEGNFKYMPSTGPVVGERCNNCGHHYRLGGPVWSAPIHDIEFVKQVIDQVESSATPLKTHRRISGMLNLALEELPDVPLHYDLSAICGIMHCQAPKMTVIRSALLNAGYRVSLSHTSVNSVKTDAPSEFIWDVMREWIKTHPINTKWLEVDSVAKRILDRPQVSEVSFEEHSEANPKSRQIGLLRWQVNPLPNWGPKPKAKRSHGDDMPDTSALESTSTTKKSKECNSPGEDAMQSSN